MGGGKVFGTDDPCARRTSKQHFVYDNYFLFIYIYFSILVLRVYLRNGGRQSGRQSRGSSTVPTYTYTAIEPSSREHNNNNNYRHEKDQTKNVGRSFLLRRSRGAKTDSARLDWVRLRLSFCLHSIRVRVGVSWAANIFNPRQNVSRSAEVFGPKRNVL